MVVQRRFSCEWLVWNYRGEGELRSLLQRARFSSVSSLCGW